MWQKDFANVQGRRIRVVRAEGEVTPHPQKTRTISVTKGVRLNVI